LRTSDQLRQVGAVDTCDVHADDPDHGIRSPQDGLVQLAGMAVAQPRGDTGMSGVEQSGVIEAILGA
jgi:hypothetical protein